MKKDLRQILATARENPHTHSEVALVAKSLTTENLPTVKGCRTLRAHYEYNGAIT